MGSGNLGNENRIARRLRAADRAGLDRDCDRVILIWLGPDRDQVGWFVKQARRDRLPILEHPDLVGLILVALWKASNVQDNEFLLRHLEQFCLHTFDTGGIYRDRLEQRSIFEIGTELEIPGARRLSATLLRENSAFDIRPPPVGQLRT